MKITNPQVKELLKRYQEVSLINSIEAVLNWDLNVCLPPKAAPGRAQQSAYLAKQVVDIFNDSTFQTALTQASAQKGLTKEEQAIIRNLNRASNFYIKVPKEIIEEKTKVTSEAYVVWQKARQDNRFKDFLPYLQRIIELDQKISEHLGYKQSFQPQSGYKNHPLDPLLDLHEPDLTVDFCRKNIVSLQPKLTALLKKVQKSPEAQGIPEILEGSKSYPVADQQKLTNFLANRMHYDLEAGRIDVSAHPFTNSLGPDDVRITTHYKEADFTFAYSSTMHETGHALYEQNINPEFSRTPLEYGISYGIHESLSRFW